MPASTLSTNVNGAVPAYSQSVGGSWVTTNTCSPAAGLPFQPLVMSNTRRPMTFAATPADWVSMKSAEACVVWTWSSAPSKASATIRRVGQLGSRGIFRPSVGQAFSIRWVRTGDHRARRAARCGKLAPAESPGSPLGDVPRGGRHVGGAIHELAHGRGWRRRGLARSHCVRLPGTNGAGWRRDGRRHWVAPRRSAKYPRIFTGHSPAVIGTESATGVPARVAPRSLDAEFRRRQKPAIPPRWRCCWRGPASRHGTYRRSGRRFPHELPFAPRPGTERSTRPPE